MVIIGVLLGLLMCCVFGISLSVLVFLCRCGLVNVLIVNIVFRFVGLVMWLNSFIGGKWFGMMW